MYYKTEELVDKACVSKISAYISLHYVEYDTPISIRTILVINEAGCFTNCQCVGSPVNSSFQAMCALTAFAKLLQPQPCSGPFCYYAENA